MAETAELKSEEAAKKAEKTKELKGEKKEQSKKRKADKVTNLSPYVMGCTVLCS